MNFDENGTLAVRVFTAGGALPLEGTRIKLTGALEENRFYETNLVTDADGLTARVVLPAPKRSYSLSPGAPEMPYATYDMIVNSVGYYTKKLYGIAVFSGVDSIQPIEMIPMGRDSMVPAPKDNLEIYIKENERLE